MYVRDLEATRQFFVRFFGAVCGEPFVPGEDDTELMTM